MKTVGVLLLSLLPILVGLGLRKQLHSRADFLRRFGRFISFVQEEIRYSGRELSEIFSLALRDPMFATPFYEALYLEQKNEKNYEKIINDTNDFRLKKSDIIMVSDFLSRLGTNDVTGQLSHCAHYFAQCERAADQAATASRTQGRLVISLSCLAAAAVFILLI